jgi:hypothetical protein
MINHEENPRIFGRGQIVVKKEPAAKQQHSHQLKSCFKTHNKMNNAPKPTSSTNYPAAAAATTTDAYEQ